MTEYEFNELADAIFKQIVQIIDSSETDIECNFNGSLLELELDDESKIVINRHSPNQEIWLAAKSGGFHYALQEGQWISKRDGSELFEQLRELVRLGSGTLLNFNP